MTLIVAGTVRIPPQNVEGLRPRMVEMMAASRAEDGFGVSDRRLIAYEVASERPI